MSFDNLNGLLDDIQSDINELKENRFDFLKKEVSVLVPEGINYLVEVKPAKSKTGNGDSLIFTFLHPKPVSDDGEERFFVKSNWISLPVKPQVNAPESEKKKFVAQLLGLVRWVNELIGEGKKADIKESLKLLTEALKTKAIELEIYQSTYENKDGKVNSKIDYKDGSVKFVDFKYLTEYQEFSKRMSERNEEKNQVDKILTAQAPKREVINENDIPF